MLQIKDIMFRATTIGTNYWIYGDLINHNNYQMIQPSVKSYPWCDQTKIRFSEQYFINPGTLCYYVGHNDISGRPIFTADILQDKNHVLYTVMSDGTGIQLKNNISTVQHLTDLDITEMQLLVIGNTFDCLTTNK